LAGTKALAYYKLSCKSQIYYVILKRFAYVVALKQSVVLARIKSIMIHAEREREGERERERERHEFT
jgi:hypothetical protein